MGGATRKANPSAPLPNPPLEERPCSYSIKKDCFRDLSSSILLL